MNKQLDYIHISWLVLLVLCFMAAPKAQAVSCYLGENAGNISDSQALDISAYLTGTANGDRIWVSERFSRTITCTSELSPQDPMEEHVYVYPYPKRASQQLPEGVELGLIFDGVDLGVFSAGSQVESDRFATQHVVKRNQTQSFDVSFQAYLVKRGDINTSGVSRVTLFQLDGSQGINEAQNRNYFFSISGWENIGSVSCSPTIIGHQPHISAIDTDKALSGKVSKTVTAATLRIKCSSATPGLMQHISAIGGTLSAAGTVFSDDSRYFASNKAGLGVGVTWNGNALPPGSQRALTMPVTGGSSNMDLVFTVTPHLTAPLSLGEPAWLFSPQAGDISSAMNLEFTPKMVETN